MTDDERIEQMLNALELCYFGDKQEKCHCKKRLKMILKEIREAEALKWNPQWIAYEELQK